MPLISIQKHALVETCIIQKPVNWFATQISSLLIVRCFRTDYQFLYFSVLQRPKGIGPCGTHYQKILPKNHSPFSLLSQRPWWINAKFRGIRLNQKWKISWLVIFFLRFVKNWRKSHASKGFFEVYTGSSFIKTFIFGLKIFLNCHKI